jgi:hypothetical protein
MKQKKHLMKKNVRKNARKKRKKRKRRMLVTTKFEPDMMFGLQHTLQVP